MIHTQKQFSFIVGSKVKEFTTKPYSYKIEDVIVNRFGRDALKKVTEGKHFEYDFTIEEVKEDFPKLFEGDLSKVNFYTTPIDVYVAAYHFFLSYKRNAWLRQLQSEKETALSLLRETQRILRSIPASSLPGQS